MRKLWNLLEYILDWNELSILDKPIDADQLSGPVMKVPERKTK